MNDEENVEISIEDKLSSQVLKGVMGKCNRDITGMCTVEEAVELIRALNHRQEVKVQFN